MTNNQTFPSYWSTRALVLLSLREELASRLSVVGLSGSIVDSESGVGSQAELLKDILAVFTLSPSQSKNKALHAQA